MSLILVLAAVIFLLVISPDLLWNHQNTMAMGRNLNYGDHLSRIDGIGFNQQPWSFYARDLVRVSLAGFEGAFEDPAAEYPSMNSASGVLLLASLFLACFQRTIREKLLVCLVLFAVMFGFFTFAEMGGGRRGLDPIVWFRVDLTLLAAIPVAGAVLAGSRHWWRTLAFGIAGCAMIWSLVGVAGKLGFEARPGAGSSGRMRPPIA